VMAQRSVNDYSTVTEMKQLLCICLFVFSSAAFAQSTDTQNRKVVTNSEPAYPKGEQALYTEVLYNVNYPDAAKKKFVEGEVTLSFDVKADSSVANVMVISGVGNGVDEEVKKYIEKLKFAPAIQNGKPVKMSTMYTFPVKAH
jgi:TonB family protein